MKNIRLLRCSPSRIIYNRISFQNLLFLLGPSLHSIYTPFAFLFVFVFNKKTIGCANTYSLSATPSIFSLMASSLALKRLVSSTLLPRSLRSTITPAATSASRFFNTNAVRQYDDDGDDRDLDVDRRSFPRRRDIFSDVFDPFSPTRSLSQVLNLMDQMTENPFFAGTRGGLRRGWDAKEDDNALNLRIDMPGLGKEDVKITLEQSTLVIKGEGAKEGNDEESVRRYTSRIDLPEKIYRTDQIKAEMKNGVLKVVVPKVKEEERNDVFQVKVE